jgi:hypothetical protein
LIEENRERIGEQGAKVLLISSESILSSNAISFEKALCTIADFNLK